MIKMEIIDFVMIVHDIEVICHRLILIRIFHNRYWVYIVVFSGLLIL
jgi:hypothetical protein